MILFSIQLLLTAVTAILFIIFIPYPTGLLGVLTVIGVALAAFFAVFVFYVIFTVIYIYANTKTNPKCMAKHRLYNEIGVYLFNVWLRVRLKITGRENLPKTNRFVAFANHSEYTDPVFLKRVVKDYPVAFIAKEELFHYPVLKNLMLSAGCIPLFRGMDRKGLQAIIDAINAVKEGQPMAIFPEGTRSYSNQMIPFKAGSFKVVLKAHADILPVCLYNMQGVLNWKRFKIHTAYLHVCPVIPYDTFKDMDTNAISTMVQGIIQNQLDQYEGMMKTKRHAKGK